MTCGSAADECFELHKEKSTKCVFSPSRKGIFYSSVNDDVASVLVT